MITQSMIVRRGAAIAVAFSMGLGATAVAAQDVNAGAAAADGKAVPGIKAGPAPGLGGHAVTVAPLTPEAMALRDALEARLGAGDTAIQAYGQRAYRPLWLDADGRANAAARLLVSVLQQAGNHALPAAKYQGDRLAARLRETGPALEADLTAAFLAYAGDLNAGVLNPRNVDREIYVFPERPDHGRLIAGAAAADNIAAYLDSLAPQSPDYRRLVERYAAFRSVAGGDIWGAPVARGSSLREGARGGRVAQARARLTAMGDLDPNVYQYAQAADGTQIAANDVAADAPHYDPDVFDQPMTDALKRFQKRHGLNEDGVIGPATLRQLNTSPRERAEQIAVNLERMRWMNGKLEGHYILVNLAAFTVDVMRNGRSEYFSRVVIGKAGEDRTVEFSDTMDHMVINPSWYVPTSIKEKSIMPKLAADPNYLARRGMRMLSNGRIVQSPGRGNALGTVKFMFPNRFAIYLHDTPTKHLFNRDIRAYSHGCIRVQKPHELAAYLLQGQAADPMGYFQRILRTGRERRVDLEKPLPVHITYRSAWIDENGLEQFRGDIYGRDRRVARALQSAGVTILQ